MQMQGFSLYVDTKRAHSMIGAWSRVSPPLTVLALTLTPRSDVIAQRCFLVIFLLLLHSLTKNSRLEVLTSFFAHICLCS